MDKIHSAKSHSGEFELARTDLAQLGVIVNGKLQVLENPITLAKLIALNNITQPDMVSVQLNGEFIYKESYESTILNDGDEVDFLYFMGGGRPE
jgi:sulfur carrier protein